MQQLKQILMTLALLMTVAMGAWAQTETYSVKFEANGNSKTIENVTLPKTWACNYSSENGELDLIIKELYGANAQCSATNPGTSVTGGNGKVTVVSSGDQSITITEPFEGTATVTGQYVTQDWTIFTYSLTISIPGYVAPASTTVNLTRGTGDKANEWTFDDGMPAGNVTVNVEYYDYAELTAADAIAANNAARAQTDDKLATVAENPATGGTLMYYLTTDATFTQAQALALAETDWSSTVPTAEDIDGAGATVYLWYYIKGDAEHSDTDPVQLTVTVQPEPTYNVEFAAGTNPDAPADPVWTATPSTGVKKGDKVTVTYTGTRKALGVKAEKKGAAPEIIMN